MKNNLILSLLLFTANSCISQQLQKSPLEVVLEKNITRMELSKLSFFAKELIHLGCDSSFQSKFCKKLTIYNSINRRTDGDKKEYDLNLFLLYNNIAKEKTSGDDDKKSKDFLLRFLNDHKKLAFLVTEDLIIQQIDPLKRGLTNGYDEGTISESSFIFFCYDPLLYKRALLAKNFKEDWDRTSTFLCNYLRDNENPLPIRSPIKKKIIIQLTQKGIQHEFEEVVQDLSACDVSSNLFD